jgi:hypothetical protein
MQSNPELVGRPRGVTFNTREEAFVRRNNGPGEIPLLLAPSRHLAPGLGRLGRQTFPRPEDLGGKFAVKLTNLL